MSRGSKGQAASRKEREWRKKHTSTTGLSSKWKGELPIRGGNGHSADVIPLLPERKLSDQLFAYLNRE